MTVTKTGELTTPCINYVPEYIESTGTQYIDTGISYSTSNKYEFYYDFQQMAIKSGYALNGWDAGGQLGWSDGSWSHGYGAITISGLNNTDRAQLSLVIESGSGSKSVIYYNNTAVGSRTHASLSSYAQQNYMIFATASKNTITYYTTERIYGVKIYVNDELKREFIPALDDNNVVCLYDKVTKQYFYNLGTGTFNYEMMQVGHIFGEWEITQSATCIETGIQTRICTVCGATETEEIPIDTENGHNFVDGTCTLCGKSIAIPTTTPYVGCYADFEADGTIDGIIFADQGYGITGTSPWGGSWGVYEVPKITSGLKEYYVSQESYTNSNWGTRSVISPIDGTNGTDRFYVMALSDFTTSLYSTFNCYLKGSGLNDLVGTAEHDFGEGYTKTGEMIKAWNSATYGAQSDSDIWKHIQTKYADGWFVPSKGEWSAFAGELGISSWSVAVSYDIDYLYWSSSQYNQDEIYVADFSDNVCIISFPITAPAAKWVRLGTKF